MRPPFDLHTPLIPHEPQGRLTAGELRLSLQEIGNPWTVDPRLGDDDLIPHYSSGGTFDDDLTGITILDGDITEFIQQLPPSNPFLQAQWIEMGLLSNDAVNEEWVSTNPDETIEPMTGEDS